MLRIILTLILLAASAPAADWSGLCTAVTDGDTIRVLSPDRREVRIRLYGIDAPERRQPYGTTSRDYLADLVHRREVTVRPVDTDQYGRVVGLVEASDVIVNREMVAAGLAWVYPQYCRLQACDEWREMETEAKADRRGLWADKEPVAPWVWRRERRGR